MDGGRSRIDVLLASACAVAGVFLVLLRVRSGVGWAPPWLEISAQVACAAALLVRSRHPLAVLAGCAAAGLVSPVIAALGALHAVGLYVASTRTSLAAVLAAVTVSWPTWLLTSEPSGPAALWVGVLVLVFAYAAGRLQRAQHEADELAATKAEAQARAGERAALARDLHDVVSHRMTYAVVEAELLGTAGHDDDVRMTAHEIAETCRAALVEMRTVLRALTGPNGAPRGATSEGRDDSAALDALVADARRAGQPVDVVGNGLLRTPHDLVDRTVLRVVGEGLTNAVRHAPGAATRVEIVPAHGTVRVSVENDRPGSPSTGLTTGGFGITGLRERVELLGGSLEAGATDDGGYRLTAELPRGS